MKHTTPIVLVLALLAGACGAGEVGSAGPVTLPPDGDDGTTTTTPAPTTTTTEVDDAADVTTTVPDPPDDGTSPGESLVFVDVFFVKEGIRAAAVTRSVEGPAVATNAIRALLEGPSDAEQARGLFTAVPDDTLLLGIEIADGIATIDLSREFEVGGGSLNILSRLAQVVYTLTQFPTVDAVTFRLDGEPITLFSGEGVVLDHPVDRSDYETILPIDSGTGTADVPSWEQDDMADIAGVDPSLLAGIVLLEATDLLPVREDPGSESPPAGMLSPDVVVRRTGSSQVAGSSIWTQIETPAGARWVDDRFLAARVDDAEFRADGRIPALLERFATIVAQGGDLRPVTSRRGLYVEYHSAPILFTPGELEGILTDPTTYRWPSNIVSRNDPEFSTIPGRTFAEAVGDGFLAAYDDPDVTFEYNEWRGAADRGIPEAAIPLWYGLRAFNYVGVHAGGDDPDAAGTDWITWYVAFDYEDDEPRIVGLTIDAWEP